MQRSATSMAEVMKDNHFVRRMRQYSREEANENNCCAASQGKNSDDLFSYKISLNDSYGEYWSKWMQTNERSENLEIDLKSSSVKYVETPALLHAQYIFYYDSENNPYR